MNILYHLTILPPKMPAGEALSQEITALRQSFGGRLIYLNPNSFSPLYIPRLAFGFHKLSQIRRIEANLDIHHFYNPDPYAFPIVRFFRRPVIYTISSGVKPTQPNLAFFSSLAAIAVSDERSFNLLTEWGLENVFLVRSGIDTSRFSFSPQPLRSEFRLMIGSAPWTTAQFRTKGIDALLAAAKMAPKLRLIFLWRGVLAKEMRQRVEKLELDHQVEVIDRQVDVDQILATVHASVVLAETPGIVKAYPHSLLDSLAAGKPVLVSRAISMADYVERTGCGLVIEQISPADILAALDSLATHYPTAQRIARHVGRRDFSQKAMIESYRNLYEQILRPTKNFQN